MKQLICSMVETPSLHNKDDVAGVEQKPLSNVFI